MSGARRLIRNARLLDPDSGLDAAGDLLIEGDKIAAIGPGLADAGLADDTEIIDAGGLCLAPGLVDMRVQLREPGAEHMESIESAGHAAAAGGVTTMVALPNTDPPIDEPALVEFVARRSRDVGLARIRTYGAATRGIQECGARITGASIRRGCCPDQPAVLAGPGIVDRVPLQANRRCLTTSTATESHLN